MLPISGMIHAIWQQGEDQRNLSLLGDSGIAGLGRFWKKAIESTDWGAAHEVSSNLWKMLSSMGIVIFIDGVETYTDTEYICVAWRTIHVEKTGTCFLDQMFPLVYSNT